MTAIGKIIGKTIGYVSKFKAPKSKVSKLNIVSRVETNTAGRILKMQDAKHAFLAGKNYNVMPAQVMQKPANLQLVTKDNFAEKIAKMYPESKSGAAEYKNLLPGEKINILRKRQDVRAAVKDNKVYNYDDVKLENPKNLLRKLCSEFMNTYSNNSATELTLKEVQALKYLA